MEAVNSYKDEFTLSAVLKELGVGAFVLAMSQIQWVAQKCPSGRPDLWSTLWTSPRYISHK